LKNTSAAMPASSERSLALIVPFAASNYCKKEQKNSYALGGVCNAAFLSSCLTTGAAAQNYRNATNSIYVITNDL
jgi:hypothetical protein